MLMSVFRRCHLSKPAYFRGTLPEAGTSPETLEPYSWKSRMKITPIPKTGTNPAIFQRNQSKSLKVGCGTVVLNR